MTAPPSDHQCVRHHPVKNKNHNNQLPQDIPITAINIDLVYSGLGNAAMNKFLALTITQGFVITIYFLFFLSMSCLLYLTVHSGG